MNFFPADFVALDTEPVRDPSNHSPVILGRPFLTTIDAVIRCRNEVMTLSFGNMTVDRTHILYSFHYTPTFIV